jgi:hypothetical protein
VRAHLLVAPIDHGFPKLERTEGLGWRDDVLVANDAECSETENRRGQFGLTSAKTVAKCEGDEGETRADADLLARVRAHAREKSLKNFL